MLYSAHGMLIASDVSLPLPVAESGTPDLVIRRAEDRPVPHERPDGVRLAEIARPDHTIFYTLSRSATGYVLRYPNLCDFVANADFSHLAVHLHPGADEGLLPVLIAGAVLAMRLMLREELVLHASAVEVAGRAVAFVGKSGMGKSTLATALCALGHPLISDDLLRVDKALVVYPGATETRLRENARPLANGNGHETADGRLALRPGELADGPVPLAACVIPRPSRDVTRVVTRRLPPVAALLRLSGYPRVLGWTDPTTMAAGFQSLADLVERIPILEADVPWGPPFEPDALNALVAAVAEECAALTA
jgi:HPr Serine kinase C-terminal domain